MIGAAAFVLTRDVIGALTTGWMLWFGLFFAVLVLFKTAHFQLDILREICERFLFVSGGKVAQHPTFASLLAQREVRTYLGALAP